MRLRAAHMLMAGAVVALAGCDTAEEAVDDAARVPAKATVEKVLTVHLPESVPQAQIGNYSDCIIDNSGVSEIREFAKASVLGVDDDTIKTVRVVLTKPETVTCITKALAGAT